MRVSTRDDEMKKSFVLHAKRIARTLGLLTDSMLAQIDSRTGEHLTREAQAVKRAFLNVWRPVWNNLVPGGLIPSGKSQEEMREAFKVKMWQKLEQIDVENKEQQANLETRKHVGERILYAIEEETYWGTIKRQGTTLTTTSIKWDDSHFIDLLTKLRTRLRPRPCLLTTSTRFSRHG